MAPKSEDSRDSRERSSMGIPQVPAPRLGAFSWLTNKRKIDGAEGLWRIHDDLYDFSDFVDNHPGGPEWLYLTKGIDITEAFEAHHISVLPEQMLKKYHVRKATTKRAVPFTFKEDGFYKTLKREVRAVVKDLPRQPARTSAFFIDTLLLGIFFFAILANHYWNFWLATLSGACLAWCTVAGHNYFHMKDSFRRFYFNMSLMTSSSWRVSHALSHHLYTNTINDMEMYIGQPLQMYFPVKKNLITKYGAVVLQPILESLGFHMQFFINYLPDMIRLNWKYFHPTDLLGLTLPLAMYVFAGHTVMSTLGMWTYIIMFGSFQFFLIGLNAAHHHPDIFHDGDTPRPHTEMDWGIAQLDTVMDRIDITGSHFLVLTFFGDHGLHHMFPAMDHGVLDHIYPVFNRVCKQFNIDLRMVSQFQLLKGQIQQLCRSEPNPNPPDLNKKYV